MPRRLLIASLPFALGLLTIFAVPRSAAIHPEGWRLLAIFAATIAGLILQPLPGGAVVLIGVTFAALFGGLTIQHALSGYGDPTVWLVIAAFIIARALIKTGAARRIALHFVRLVGHTSLGVCYALSFSDMVLAAIIPSNAARSGGVILPIARSISELYGSLPGATAGLMGSFLITGLYQNICVTAAMFYTGQASNPLAAEIATRTFHYPVTWTSWFLAGIVPGLCSLAISPLIVMRLNPPSIRRTPEAAAFARRELTAMGATTRNERIVFAVFVSVCAAWVTAPLHGIDITLVALVGSCFLLASGVLAWDDVKEERAAWDIFVWYGGLLMLGKALNEAGVTREFARAVSTQFSGFGWPALLAIALAVYFYAHYGFASITAHILAMYAPFVAVLLARGAPPGLAVFSLACFANFAAGLTHFGTTPSPIFFSQGYAGLRLWWKIGAAVSVSNLLIWSIIGFGWWKLLAIW